MGLGDQPETLGAQGWRCANCGEPCTIQGSGHMDIKTLTWLCTKKGKLPSV